MIKVHWKNKHLDKVKNILVGKGKRNSYIKQLN